MINYTARNSLPHKSARARAAILFLAAGAMLLFCAACSSVTPGGKTKPDTHLYYGCPGTESNNN